MSSQGGSQHDQEDEEEEVLEAPEDDPEYVSDHEQADEEDQAENGSEHAEEQDGQEEEEDEEKQPNEDGFGDGASEIKAVGATGNEVSQDNLKPHEIDQLAAFDKGDKKSAARQYDAATEAHRNDVNAKRNYILFLRDLVLNVENTHEYSSLISYRIADKTQQETRLRACIEVPFERSDRVESIYFEIQTTTLRAESDGSDINMSSSFELRQLGLTENNPIGTFVLSFHGSGENQDFECKLIFDASVIDASLEGVSKEQQSATKEDAVHIFTLNVKRDARFEKYFEEFRQRRVKEIREQYALSTATVDTRYRLDVQLFSQEYSIWLDDPEVSDIYLFFLEKWDPNRPNALYKDNALYLSLQEITYEKYTIETGKGEEARTEQRANPPNIVGEQVRIDPVKDFLKADQKKTSLEINCKFGEGFSVSFQLSKISNTAFHQKFLGYTALKVLETRFFDSAAQPTHIELHLVSMDNFLPEQIWVLRPQGEYLQSGSKVVVWDFQHNLVYRNNLKLAEENEDTVIPKSFIQTLFPPKETAAFGSKVQESVWRPDTLSYRTFSLSQATDDAKVPQDTDFKLMLLNYLKINRYESALEEHSKRRNLTFSNKPNHLFFMTTCPFDYLSMRIYTNETMIGLYEESFYKLPENELLLGHVTKAPNDGKVHSLFKREGENLKDGDDEGIEDRDDVVGTIKFVMHHIGYNDQILRDYTWIQDLQNTLEDDDNFLKQIKDSILNHAKRTRKIYQIKMALDNIWNLTDLVACALHTDQFDLRLKLGSISHIIRFKVKRENKRDFKNTKILYEMEKNSWLMHVQTYGDQLTFYARLKVDSEEVIFTVTTDTDISASLVFEIQSYMDCLIVELKSVPENQIVAFYAVPICYCYIFDKKGTILVPIKIPKKGFLSLLQKKEAAREKRAVESTAPTDTVPDSADEFKRTQQGKGMGEQQREAIMQQGKQVVEEQEQEEMLLGQLNDKQKGLMNSVVYFKFSFTFLMRNEQDINFDKEAKTKKYEEETFKQGIYNIGVFLTQMFNTPRELEKRLKDFVYELRIYDLSKTKLTAIARQIVFNPKIQKFHIELINGGEFLTTYVDNTMKLRVILTRLYSDEDDSENDRPNVFDKIILVNCKEQDRQDIVKKDIVTQMLRPNGKKYERADIDRSTILKINQYEYFPVAFKEVLLGIDLQFLLYISFRSSPFIDEPKGKLTLALTQELEKKMVTSDILESQAELRFKVTTLNKDGQSAAKSNKNYYLCGLGKRTDSQFAVSKEMEFLTFDTRDTLVIQIFNGGVLTDTAVQRVSDLLSMPLSKIKGGIDLNDTRADAAEKQLKALSEEELVLEEKYDWSFINFSNKKLEFLLSYVSNSSLQEAQGTLDAAATLENTQGGDTSAQKFGGDTNISYKKSVGADGTKKAAKVEPETILWKKKIIELKKKNELITTQLTREKKDWDKKKKYLDDINVILDRIYNPQKDKKKKSAPISDGSTKGAGGNTAKDQPQSAASKARALFQSYCKECIAKMKDEYEAALKEYKPVAQEYEDTFVRNSNIDQKIEKMKKKIDNYKKKAAFIDTDDPGDDQEKMLLTEIQYLRENIKLNDAQIIMMEREHKTIVQEQQDLQKDIESKIMKKTEKLQTVNSQLDELEGRIRELSHKIEENNKQLKKTKDEQNH